MMCLEDTCPEIIKLFFVLSSAEYKIFSANKCVNVNNSGHFHNFKPRQFSCSVMFSKKEFAIVSKLIFISGTNFMLS